MTDLISRLQSATGPSRKLDAEIFEKFGKIDERHCRDWCSMDGRANLTRNDFIRAWAPLYTKSLDAALTLVPEGWRMYELSEWDGIEPCGWSCKLRRKNLVTPVEVSAGFPESDTDYATKQLPTPAVAVVIACRKAMEVSQ